MDQVNADAPLHGWDSAALLGALVDSSFDAIISKDLNSVITSWNPAAERMFGFTAEEAVGRSILIIIPDGRQDEEISIIERVRCGERVETLETVRQRKDGSLFHVSITVSPIIASDGTIMGASKIARDITSRKESDRKIQLLMREVNHRVKNQFAVVLSMIRETERRSTTVTDFAHRIRERIMALARSQDLLVNGDWSGASMSNLVRDHLMPFGHEEQILISGPEISAGPSAIQILGMAFHELGTNSAKYGALSMAEGQVLVEWSLTQDGEGEPALFMVWEETFPRKVPSRRRDNERSGFGSVVLKRVTPQALSGAVSLDLKPNSLRWTLTAPLSAILPPIV